MTTAPLILLAAGGTGGHLFPAEALGVELIRRGFRVRLATDCPRAALQRIVLQGHDRRGAERDRARPHAVVAGPYRRRCSPPAPLVALNLMRRLKPAAVVGFGGYPTVPPLLAARLFGVPGLIHEANAVLGRANRFLSGRVSAIATSLPGVLDRDPALAARRPPSARRCARRSSRPPR